MSSYCYMRSHFPNAQLMAGLTLYSLGLWTHVIGKHTLHREYAISGAPAIPMRHRRTLTATSMTPRVRDMMGLVVLQQLEVR